MTFIIICRDDRTGRYPDMCDAILDLLKPMIDAEYWKDFRKAYRRERFSPWPAL